MHIMFKMWNLALDENPYQARRDLTLPTNIPKCQFNLVDCITETPAKAKSLVK